MVSVDSTMKTKVYSTSHILQCAFCILLFSTAARASTQTGWGTALSFDGGG